MSDKMTCPGCGAHTSAVLINVSRDEPCPYCGLSADAIMEVAEVRRKTADEDLKTRLEKALIERDRAVTEAVRLGRILEEVRSVLAVETPR